MITWFKRIACWIPKATNTHLEYAIFIVFPLWQWLHERVSLLRYTHLHCSSYYIFLLFSRMWCLLVSDMIIRVIGTCTAVHNVVRAFPFLYDEEERLRTYNCSSLKKHPFAVAEKVEQNCTSCYQHPAPLCLHHIRQVVAKIKRRNNVQPKEHEWT